MGKQWKLTDFIFLGSKITADGDCSHEIKRRLLLGRKVVTNLDSILKSRDITLSTKVHLVKAMVFPLGWTGWISLQSKGLARVFSNTRVQKHQFFGAQLSSQSNSHPYMTTGKTIALTRQNFVGKVMSLLFNMLSRLVITLLPRSKCLLISWLQSPSAVILEPPQNKV